jgi:hypothetical protein
VRAAARFERVEFIAENAVGAGARLRKAPQAAWSVE